MSRHCQRLVLLGLVLLFGGPVRSEPPADRQGDALPTGALLRLGTTRFRHGSAIQSVALSPDGKSAAAADRDGAVCLWELATGQKRHEFPVRTGHVVCFAPDGKTLATGGNEVRLWDATTGAEIRRLDFQAQMRESVRGLAFSPDGKRLAAAAGAVRLWDVASGRQLNAFDADNRTACAVAFSPDGKLLAGGSGFPGRIENSGVRLWDVESGKEVRKLGAQQGQVSSLAFAADGKTLAAACPSEVQLWDLATGKVQRRLEGAGTVVAFSPIAALLATAEPFAVHDAREGVRTAVMAGNVGRVNCLAFSRDGRLIASGGQDGLVRFWESDTGREAAGAGGHEQAVRAVAFSPDGTVIASASGRDRTLRLWGAASGAQLRKVPLGCTTPDHWCGQHDGSVIFFSADGGTVGTWSCDGVVHLWELATAKTREFPVGQRWVTAVGVTSDGKVLACARPDPRRGSVEVCLWDVTTAKEIRTLVPFGKDGRSRSQVASLAFSPDGKWLAMGLTSDRLNPRQLPTEDTIALWDVAEGKRVRSFRVHESAPAQLTFSPDGRLLAAGGNAQLQLWEVATGQLVRKVGDAAWDWRQRETLGFAFAPDGKVLAAAGKENEIILWETGTGKAIRKLRGHTGVVSCLAFAPDGRSLVSGSGDKTLLV